MTRFLSEALQAPEPAFRLGLQNLERANGNPSNDIRLSSRIQRQTAQKLQALGLDPKDTTAEELYHVLAEKLKADDARLVKTLRTTAAKHISAEADVVAGMTHFLANLSDKTNCFALKATSLKSLIKKNPPKKTMKALGYRSLESFLKHEKPALILAASWLAENSSWHHQLLDSYKKLKASDFEDRKIAVIHADSKRWQALAHKTVDQKRHNLISFKEFGTIILLPLPSQIPAGVVTASLSLALHEINDIRACSSFLKICQVRPDFGNMVRTVVVDEPSLSSALLDQSVPWHLIHRYYGQIGERFREEIFGPHVRQEDMSWRAIEHDLINIEPSLEFWLDSSHLGLMHKHQPVSLNLVDAALNVCNNLPFEKRLTQAFKRSLWHELLLEYLNHDTVEQTVLRQLEPKLLAVPAKA